MTPYPYRALVTAENIAEKHDVIDSFRQIYRIRREYTDIFESVEYTMQYLGLYDTWRIAWVASCDNV
jgi:hypothetical protein